MSKKLARWARVVREITGALVAILKVIKLVVDLMNNGANCNVCTAH